MSHTYTETIGQNVESHYVFIWKDLQDKLSFQKKKFGRVHIICFRLHKMVWGGRYSCSVACELRNLERYLQYQEQRMPAGGEQVWEQEDGGGGRGRLATVSPAIPFDI